MANLSSMNYAKAGVSITAQNDVNRAIKEKLQEIGLVAEGLFGGATDISSLKGNKIVPIGILSSSIVEDEDTLEAGKKTVYHTFAKLKGEVFPKGGHTLALLDYFASEGMDVNEVPAFVEGVARAGLEFNIPTIGGESAQMPGTYNERQRDAYVHLIYHGIQGTTVDIAELIKDMEKPLLCASTDGTGTKTRIVKDPRDIIYHGSNDLGAIGVQPVAFAMYVAGNAPLEELQEIAAKSQKICDTLGIIALDSLVEFKPAEYVEGQVDIAGTVIGVVDERDMIKGEGVKGRDIIIGFAADSLMTNGYSLARRYCKMTGHSWDDENLPGLEGTTIRKELSKPHIPYIDILFGNETSEGILSKFKDGIKATAHITGGGQKDNIERMVPDGLCAAIMKEILPLPPIVEYFKANGADMGAMYEAFNMGVGFTVTVSRNTSQSVVNYVNDNFRQSIDGIDRQAMPIGMIESGGARGQRFRFI